VAEKVGGTAPREDAPKSVSRTTDTQSSGVKPVVHQCCRQGINCIRRRWETGNNTIGIKNKGPKTAEERHQSLVEGTNFSRQDDNKTLSQSVLTRHYWQSPTKSSGRDMTS